MGAQARPPAHGRPEGHDRVLLRRGRGHAGPGARRRDRQHELGSRDDRDGRREPAAVRRREGRRAGVQQEPRAQPRAPAARQRAVPGLDRDELRRARRSRVPPLGRGGHAAGPVGAPPGRGGGRALPRLAGSRLRHRPGGQRQRRHRDVVTGDREGGIPMEASAKPKTYEPEEIEAKLKEAGLDDWYLEGDWIRRKYNTDGWPTTLMVVNAVGFVCEAAYHHADLSVTWGKLWVKLRNHAAGGITDKDFAVARQIEDTVLWRPEDDSPLEGTPNKFVFSKGGR